MELADVRLWVALELCKHDTEDRRFRFCKIDILRLVVRDIEQAWVLLRAHLAVRTFLADACGHIADPRIVRIVPKVAPGAYVGLIQRVSAVPEQCRRRRQYERPWISRVEASDRRPLIYAILHTRDVGARTGLADVRD